MKKTAFILALVAGLLILTNPGPEDFKNFIKKKSVEQFKKETGLNDQLAESIISVFGGVFAEGFIRDNYLLFSIYKWGDYKLLGIAGQFIPLSKWDENILNEISDDQLGGIMNEATRELEQVLDTLDVEKFQQELEKATEELLQQLENFMVEPQ